MRTSRRRSARSLRAKASPCAPAPNASGWRRMQKALPSGSTASRAIRRSSAPMSRVGRAIEKGETQGFMKIVVDAETRKILGAAILGTGGDEAIHGVIDMMNAGASYPVLQRAVPIHPTVSELIPTMLGELQPIR